MEVIMTSQHLPERPSLEQLKEQAKSLLHARTKDPTALQQFHALLAFSLKSGVGADALSLALHDAQSVSAREYGFKSWYEMREYVEEHSLSFRAPAAMAS
jgi:hypothetical protein